MSFCQPAIFSMKFDSLIPFRIQAMIVKRISYFSFLVALTAMAAVSPCSASGEPAEPALNTAPRVINKSIATCFDKIAKAFDYTIGVTRSFKENTLRSGKLISTHTALCYGTVRTDLKFTAHPTHQSIPPGLLPAGAQSRNLKGYAYYSIFLQQPKWALDRRAGIEQKNRILLE